METINTMNHLDLIFLTAIACFAVSLLLTVVATLVTRNKQVVEPVADRYVYPKKDWSEEEFITISQGRKIPNPDYVPKSEMGCDCDNGIQIIWNGELPDVYLGTDEERVNIQCAGAWKMEGVELEKEEPYDPEITVVEQYMKRGNKRYFRGDNVKVVVTVKN